GTLLDASVLDNIGHTTNRAKGRIQLEAANAAAFVFISLTGISRLVATATAHDQTHVQRTIVSQVGNHVIAVDDLDVVLQLDVRRSDGTRALLGKGQSDFVTAVQLDGQALQVEQDFDNVLLNTFDRAVFVKHADDLCLDNGTARHGGQQDATQCVAQGVAETTLERLERDLGAGLTDRLHINVTGGQELIYRNLHGVCTYLLALTWSRARQSGSR